MPAAPVLANAITQRLPKVISPAGHAVADYLTLGIFLAAGALFWKKNRPAATAALLCGSVELALNLVTDYPGGVAKFLDFPAHGKFDMALAGITAAMPELFLFKKGRTFFLVQAGAMTATSNLTTFRRSNSQKRPFRVA